MKVKVTIPREKIKRHSVNTFAEGGPKDEAGSAVFSFEGDGIHYYDVPFGSDFAKLIRQTIPAEAAARGEDVEWDIQVPKTYSYTTPTLSYSKDMANNEDGMIGSIKDRMFTRATADKPSEMKKNVVKVKKDDVVGKKLLKTLAEDFEEAFRTGDFTPILGADAFSKQMLSADENKRFKNTGFPLYDINQWEDLSMPETAPSWAELQDIGTINEAIKDSTDYNQKKAKEYLNRKERFYQGLNKRYAEALAKGKIKHDDYDDSELAAQNKKERDLKSGRQSAMNQQYKNFLKWAAKELNVSPWQDLKKDFDIELFDKVYQYDDMTDKGWFDRNELIDFLRTKLGRRNEKEMSAKMNDAYGKYTNVGGIADTIKEADKFN